MSPNSFIEETLRLAGTELLSRFGQENNVREKKDSSLVTDADLASEKVILGRIAKFFHGDAVISEESGQMNVTRNEGQHVWVVDPLDGTTNFANGFPFFSISIARGVFTNNGSIKVLNGGIFDPVHNKMYLATHDAGAICNGKSMSVKPGRALNHCFLVTGFYYTQGADLDNEINRFQKIAQVCQSIRRDGSAALDLALVAAGVYDAFWERGLAVWDVAAGSLLVRESGGTVSNYPSAKTASLGMPSISLSYNLEGDGIIAGSPVAANSIHTLMA